MELQQLLQQLALPPCLPAAAAATSAAAVQAFQPFGSLGASSEKTFHLQFQIAALACLRVTARPL